MTNIKALIILVTILCLALVFIGFKVYTKANEAITQYEENINNNMDF